jgi:hypothetical protein
MIQTPEDLKKIHRIFLKSSPNSLQTDKGQNIYKKLNLQAQNVYVKPLLKP